MSTMARCATLLFFTLPWVYTHAFCSDLEYTQQGHVLINHVMESLMGTSLFGCTQKCDANIFCSSINIYTDKGLCELNNGNHYSHPEDLVPASHHTSYMIYSLHQAFVCSSSFCSQADERCFMKNGTIRQCVDCVSSLGMEDGRITDEQITASSYFSSRTMPKYGRLGTTLKAGCWAAKESRVGEYLQIDLGKSTLVSKVATQGRHQYPYKKQRVTRYYLTYSMDGNSWQPYKYLNQIKEFPGNYEKDTVVTNSLPIPIKTRYVRIVVMAWNRYASMRTELYGCTSP